MLSYIQAYLLQPLRPLLRLLVPDLRRSEDAGVDVADLVLNKTWRDRKGYIRLMVPGPSSEESLDETKQEKIWNKTARWAKITKKDTKL